MSSAEHYDELANFASLAPETDAEVDGLSRLARRGRVLELGAGTGRVSIPLAQKGLEVHAIEIDPDMIAQLRRKQGADQVHVHAGDMADVDVEGDFDLIFAVFGTFFALPSQQEQLRCLRNATAHLARDGRLAVEALVPQPADYRDGHRMSVAHAADDQVVINISQIDLVGQTITNRQLVVRDGRIDIVPIHIRYCWPAELDLMAQVAGLRLVQRWRDWDQAPFRHSDVRHISIYAHASAPAT